jgi:hypothetical protein
MRELQEQFVEPDGNFVEQLQTARFDARKFEFFMFSMPIIAKWDATLANIWAESTFIATLGAIQASRQTFAP